MKEDDFLKWNGEYLVPRRVTIETIFGCNAKCAMCVINHPTERKKGIMPRENFHRIVDSITPYRDDFKMFDLFGLGEPLLDPYIFDRIRYVKKKGFKSLAISTNADLLSPDKQKALLDSGIETVLFSIDGIKKATHESIRHGVNFNRVVKNVTDVIRKRDAGGYQTRFIMRFVSQPENKGEWDAYKSFWEDKLTKEKNDFVTAYDMHSWGGEIASKEKTLENRSFDPEIEIRPCHHIFYNLIILADGSVPLCSEDFLRAKYDIGNAIKTFPLDIFNSQRFNGIRKIHISGNKNYIKPCNECTVLYSEAARVTG